MPDLAETPFGFKWGPLTVTRLTEHRGDVWIDLTTIDGKSVTVFSSAKGKSLRVFGDGWEGKE